MLPFLTALMCFATANAVEPGSTGGAWQIPHSGIDLTRVYSELRIDYDVVNRHPGPLYAIDCADFVNRTNGTITNVQLMFSMVAPDGVKEPPLTFNVAGLLAAGAESKHSSCLDHAYENGDHGYRMVGWVNAVSYQDGRVWHAAPAVQGTVGNASASGLQLANPFTYLPLEECDNVTNASSKVVTHVQIVFEHRGRDGAVLGSDALDVRRHIEPGTTMMNACRAFNGSSEPSVTYYGWALSRGETNVQPPRIYYAGKETVLSVRLTEVDFAGGSSWRPSDST